MTETLVVNNVEMAVQVKTQEEMNALYRQDVEMASRTPYRKGDSIVVPFGKAGCVTYTKRLNGTRLVRKVWRGNVLKHTCVCHL